MAKTKDLTTYTTDFDRVFENRDPLFFTSATLHRSMGGHGFAFPCWTLPPVLYHCPRRYDAKKLEVTAPSVFEEDKRFTVKDAVGNTWKLEEDLLQGHQSDVERIQANACKGLEAIKKLEYTAAVLLLDSALAELWPCHRDMSLCFWLQLHRAHALFRSAFYVDLGALETAKQLLNQALHAFQECIDNTRSSRPLLSFNRSVIFSALVGAAWVYFFRGEMEKAMLFIRASEEVVVDKADIKRRGGPSNIDLWWALATFHAAWGELKDAEGYKKRIGCDFSQAEDVYQINAMDLNMQSILEGNYYNGVFAACNILITDSPQGRLKGKAADQMKHLYSGIIGDVWYAVGVNSEALLAYKNSLSQDNLLLRAASFIGQGNTHIRAATAENNSQGHPAETYYLDALRIYEGLEYRAGKAVVLCNLGTLYYERKNFSQALDYYHKARETSLVDVSGLDCRMAQLHMALGEWDIAHTLLHASLGNVDEGKPLLVAWIRHGIGQCLLMSPTNYNDCFHNHAEKIAGHHSHESVRRKAKENLSEAVETFAKLQYRFSSVTIGTPLSLAIFEEQKATYRLLEWCFASERKSVEALVWAERGRSRLLMQDGWDDLVQSRAGDNKQQKEFLQRFGSEEFDRLSYDMAWQHLMRWQSQCPSLRGVVIIEYTLCTDFGLIIYVIDGSKKPHVSCRAFKDLEPELEDTKKIEDFVNRTIELISELDETKVEEAESRLALLCDLLIRPVEKHLKKFKQLIIIPHEVLFKVPFAALVSKTIPRNKPGRFLVEKYVVSLAESLRSLIRSSLLMRQKSFQDNKGITSTSLVVGIKDHGAVGEAYLEQAEEEAWQVAKTLQQTSSLSTSVNLLLGMQATKEVVVGRMEQACLVHLATHAVITNKYEEGAIVFSMPQASSISSVNIGSSSGSRVLEWPCRPVMEEDGTLTTASSYRRFSSSRELAKGVLLDAQEIARMRLGSRLVVLSACQTGRGVIAGEGVAGLGRALSRAGVACTVLSLWPVWDTATCYLMKLFYEELARGKDVALAMQATMLHMIRQKTDFGGEQWRVDHWAAFTPFGLPYISIVDAFGGST